MIQVVPKWKVTVHFEGHENVLWISDNHAANVLRTVAGIDFSENGIDRPIAIRIELVR